MTAAQSECERAAVPQRYVTVQVRSGDRECSWGNCFFFSFFFFFFNRTWLLPPRSSRLRRSLCSLSKLFQSVLFFFSLQESGTDPNRPAPRVPSRYSTLNSGGGGLVAWTLRSYPAFPPRGEYCFLLPTLSFC